MKRVLTGGALAIVAALLASPAAAQTGFAKGKVVDAQGQPVVDARVTAVYKGELSNTSVRKTNKKGEYIHSGLYGGRYRITAEKEGHEPTIIEYDVVLGNPTEIPPIVLEPRKAPVVRAREAVASASDELKARFKQAADLASQGRYPEAETLFEELAVVLPDLPEIHQNLGLVYARQMNWASAEASYTKALELQPDNATSMSALAAVYESSGRHDKALELLKRAAAADPKNAFTQFNRGVFLVNANQNEEAAVAFEAALAANPGLVEAHFHLATIFLGQNKAPLALEHLDTYLAANPTNEQNVATAKALIAALRKN